MNKSKLWILNHYAVPGNKHSGTRHYDLAEQLVQRGYDVSIFASSFDHKQRKETLKWWQIYKVERHSGVRFIGVRTTPYKKNDIFRVFNMISYMIMSSVIGIFMKRPSAIIASSFHPLTWVSGWFLSVIKRARFIAEVRDLWPQSAIDMGAIREGSKMARILRRLELFIYNKAEYITVLFPGAVSYIKKSGVQESKIILIPNGVRDAGHDGPLAIKKDDHTGMFNAVYVGAHGQANALSVILHAAKIVQDKQSRIRFVFYGDGPEKENLIKLSDDLQLANVEFHDPIPKNQVPHVLSRADLGLISMLDIPLYRYGMSLNKLFDYMDSGLPVLLAGNVSNDIVQASGGGLTIPPEDPQAMADALLRLSEFSSEDRKKMGEKGRAYVLKHHHMGMLAERLESMLR